MPHNKGVEKKFRNCFLLSEKTKEQKKKMIIATESIALEKNKLTIIIRSRLKMIVCFLLIIIGTFSNLFSILL